MPNEILMPALSPTMEEGTLLKWLVKEGDEVQAGDVIAEIETDKATMEVEAVDDGTIAKILIGEGTEGILVNTPIAVIALEGEDASAASAEAAAAAPPQPQAAASPEPQIQIVSVSSEPTATAPETGGGGDGFPLGNGQPEPAANGPTQILTVREALRDAMAEEMRADEDVFLMGEEVAEYQGAYKVSQGLLEEFGARRVVDTPITEYGFTGIGVGAAFAGLRPIVEFMTWNFAMQAIDHIVNSAGKTLYMSGGQLQCPIVFRGPNGAAARVAAQHSQCYSAWYSHVPGLKVIAPYSAADAKGLLKAAIRDPNPVVCLENEILYGQSFDVPEQDDWMVPIGKAKVVREGSSATLVSFSRGMTYALNAADELAEAGIDVEVIDLRSLRPLDMATVLESVKKTNRIVTVEESWPVCSIGSEICAQVTAQAFDYLDAPPTQVSGADVPMPYAANLEDLALPSVEQVTKAVKDVCYAN